MKKLMLPVMLALAVCACVKAPEKDRDPTSIIKRHIDGITKIEIIFDLNAHPGGGWDKDKNIWTVPESDKVVITNSREIKQFPRRLHPTREGRHYAVRLIPR